VRAAISLIFSFTNGAEWDGPYTLKFRVPKPWQNKPLSFFNEVGVGDADAGAGMDMNQNPNG
jgi:hypothetical protein